MPTATERIQEVTQATVTGTPTIALDTSCVRYYLEDTGPWSDILRPIFEAGLARTVKLYMSTVVAAELLTSLIRKTRQEAGYDAELLLTAIINRHFSTLDVDETVARAAGRLRGTVSALDTPDALIGATSLINEHTLFITNDAQLADALPDTNCIYLRDAALEWLAQRFPVPCCDGSGPVLPSTRGKGLPIGASVASMALGGIQPDPSAKWRRILKDAQIVAAAVNEPCVFFILTEKNGRRMETREVLFWHKSLAKSRPPSKVINKLKNHLEVQWNKKKERYIANPKKHVHTFVLASLSREHARQDQPGFASKSDHRKATDTWNAYLVLWRTYRSCLDLPQTTWLLCEDGAARVMDIAATVRFLDQARNVLGWKDER